MADVTNFPPPKRALPQTNIGARLAAVMAAKPHVAALCEGDDVYRRLRAELMRDALAAFTVQLVADVKKIEDALREFENATGSKVLF
jgi:hypothetical protein